MWRECISERPLATLLTTLTSRAWQTRVGQGEGIMSRNRWGRWTRSHSSLRWRMFGRFGSVDLRVIEMLLKPEEKVMHRPVTSGGLAGLILETACNPKFCHSLYHELVFRYNVLEDRSLSKPTFPPSYNEKFFITIRKVHQDPSLNLAIMTE